MQQLIKTMAVVVTATGATLGAAYGMLSQQGRRARRDIVIPGWVPFRADGVYLPDGTGPRAPSDPDIAMLASAVGHSPVLRLAMLGDSLAAGLGVDQPEQLPGVVLARGLANNSGRPVQLDTLAICGCTSRRLAGQVDAALINPPHAALVMIGANDVTRRIPPWESARLLGEAVSRLRAEGTTVIVGTCPDLGTIPQIPQPLRAIAHTSSWALARLQHDAISAAGGLPVSLAQLLGRDFRTQPDILFGRDHFHPSTAGYATACSLLLPTLCSALRDGCTDDSADGWVATRGGRTAAEGSPGTTKPGSR
ncbi:MAG: lysophospholipase L1-like esterase [Pseudonocardiales bacterium]|nr:lysophospholipase L1-like esterase [Pseudonocardiales bacterium]